MHSSPHLRRRIGLAALSAAALLAVAACSGSSDTGATIDKQPPPPAHWVVSLGDSYIAGEGARWAGNTDGAPDAVDAQGPFAYGGVNGMEDIAGCHEARQSEINIESSSTAGKDLACSGAETATKIESDGSFKPGIDFYDQNGQIGQALALERFAKTHSVSAVVLSIGGNNFEFSTILTQCVLDFVGNAGSKPVYCSKDPSLAKLFDAAHAAQVQAAVQQSIQNITKALTAAGEKSSDYRIVVQGYPSPLPPGNLIRYPQTVQARYTEGGCPLFDKDATWANTTVVPTINNTVASAVSASGLTNITYLDVSQAFVGHRLCEDGVNQLQHTGLSSWRSPGAANALEWVNEVYTKGTPWQGQESAHPNFWGSMAERNCLQQVLAQTSVSATATCTHSGTSMQGVEPVMTVSG